MSDKLIEYNIKKVLYELNSRDDTKIKALNLKQACLNLDQGIYFKDSYIYFLNMYTMMVLDYEGYLDECINVLMQVLDKDAFDGLIKQYPDIMRLINLDRKLTPEYKELQNHDIFMEHMTKMYNKMYNENDDDDDIDLLKTYFEDGKNEILNLLKNQGLIE